MNLRFLIVVSAVLLAGCLEVAQHPPWRDGAYAGKTDQRTSEARFGGDRPTWQAAITERNHLQDEYRRTGH